MSISALGRTRLQPLRLRCRLAFRHWISQRNFPGGLHRGEAAGSRARDGETGAAREDRNSRGRLTGGVSYWTAGDAGQSALPRLPDSAWAAERKDRARPPRDFTVQTVLALLATGAGALLFAVVTR